jgi:hypothetical protein
LAVVLFCFKALIEPNLEHHLDPTQITFSGHNLIDFGTLKVNFGMQKWPKRPNEKLADVLFCFTVESEPRGRRKTETTPK